MRKVRILALDNNSNYFCCSKMLIIYQDYDTILFANMLQIIQRLKVKKTVYVVNIGDFFRMFFYLHDRLIILSNILACKLYQIARILDKHAKLIFSKMKPLTKKLYCTHSPCFCTEYLFLDYTLTMPHFLYNGKCVSPFSMHALP